MSTAATSANMTDTTALTSTDGAGPAPAGGARGGHGRVITGSTGRSGSGASARARLVRRRPKNIRPRHTTIEAAEMPIAIHTARWGFQVIVKGWLPLPTTAGSTYQPFA